MVDKLFEMYEKLFSLTVVPVRNTKRSNLSQIALQSSSKRPKNPNPENILSSGTAVQHPTTENDVHSYNNLDF